MRSVKTFLLILFFSKILTQSEQFLNQKEIGLDYSNNINVTIEEMSMMKNFFFQLFAGSLREENIFIISDEKVLSEVNWLGKLFMNSNTSIIISSLQQFKLENFDRSFINGFLFNVIIIFYDNSILDLIDEISKDHKWCPGKLVMISINPNFRLNSMVFSSVIQRSRFIFIAELTYKENNPVFDTYSLNPSKRNVSGLIKWKFGLGLWTNFTKWSNIFVDRTSNFYGNVLKASAFCGKNFPYYYRFSNEGSCNGSNFETLEIIKKKLNFNYVVKLEKYFGHKFPNGSWDGLFEEMQKGNRDLIINTVPMFKYVMDDFDLSDQYTEETASIFSLQPLPKPNWMKIMLPFSPFIWGLIIATVIAICVSGIILLKLSVKDDQKDISLVFLNLLGILLRQGRKNISSGIWYKILLMFWAVSAFVITNIYSANLLSHLTLPRYPHRMETIQEIANSNVRVFSNNVFKNLFLSMDNSDVKTVGKKTEILLGDYFKDKYASSLFFNRKAAFISIESHLLFIQLQENLAAVSYLFKEKLIHIYYGFAFPKYSPLTIPFTKLLNRIIETGLYSKFLKNQLENANKRWDRYHKEDIGSFSLSDLQTAFYILGCGLFLSSLVFTCEILYSKRKSKQELF